MESKTYVFGNEGSTSNNGMLGLLAPLLQKQGVDPNVLLAMKGNNGFGGEGGWFMWVIFLFFLMGWGGNGWGGHGIRSASSQVNSKFFQIPPIRCMYSLATSTSKHHLWLMMLLLGTCTSLGRFILSDTKPWNRAIWGARWDSNPRHRRLINLRTLPTELLALGKNLKHVKL